MNYHIKPPAEPQDESIFLPVISSPETLHATRPLRPPPVHMMRGDSMAPALRDGDFAIIDLDDTDVAGGGIFAVWKDDSVIVTQVERVRGSKPRRIRCTPRNPIYAPFELGAEARIIGRVAQRITRL